MSGGLPSAVGVPLAPDGNPERPHKAADFFGILHQGIKHGSGDITGVDGNMEE